MAIISEFRVLSLKDLQTLLECSETRAKSIKKDIQTEYNVKFVLFCHFKRYFNIQK